MKICYIRPKESKNRDMRIYKALSDIATGVGTVGLLYDANNKVLGQSSAITAMSRGLFETPKDYWTANVQLIAITLTAIGCGSQLFVAYQEARKKDMPFIVIKWGVGVLIALSIPFVAKLLFGY